MEGNAINPYVGLNVVQTPRGPADKVFEALAALQAATKEAGQAGWEVSFWIAGRSLAAKVWKNDAYDLQVLAHNTEE